jgi:hypothetical protein
MNEILTVSNLFNALMLVVGWSIRNELHHIRRSVEEAKTSAYKAHERIDEYLTIKK